MKKVLVVILVLIMATSLAACSAKKPEEDVYKRQLSGHINVSSVEESVVYIVIGSFFTTHDLIGIIDHDVMQRLSLIHICIGKKNWQMIDTINGAHSSAIIYSIAETAKANNLKPYDYFVYLLEEIPKHMEDTNRSFLDDLLPWSRCV